MSGSARAGTISREAYLRVMNPESLQCALSRARHGNLRFSIDKDLHGGRQTAPYSAAPDSDHVPWTRKRLNHRTCRPTFQAQRDSMDSISMSRLCKSQAAVGGAIDEISSRLIVFDYRNTQPRVRQ